MSGTWMMAQPVYLGHGERNSIDIRENGNTSVEIPVTISNLQALYAIGIALAERIDRPHGQRLGVC